MGRFGNVLLINGEPQLDLTARRGEVLRVHLTNTANTRTFNLALPGARLKLVGGDGGHYEREVLVEEILVAPSERAIVDALFERPGIHVLEHRTPGRTYTLGRVAVTEDAAQPTLTDRFDELRAHADMTRERARITSYLEREPDKTIALVAEMDMGEMHTGEPELAHELHEGGHAHELGADPIEWEDDMAVHNRQSTASNMRWKIVDRDTDAEGMAIAWRFRVGDRVKIRIANEIDSDHPMQHPFHIHGAGRFLILSRDGATEPNLVWKDTVLIPTGQTVDLLLELTNTGEWMAHCHIAEHHESGMRFSFTVES